MFLIPRPPKGHPLRNKPRAGFPGDYRPLKVRLAEELARLRRIAAKGVVR